MVGLSDSLKQKLDSDFLVKYFYQKTIGLVTQLLRVQTIKLFFPTIGSASVL